MNTFCSSLERFFFCSQTDNDTIKVTTGNEETIIKLARMASVMVKVLHFPEPLSAFYSWKIIQLSQEAIKKLPNAFLKEDWQQQINTEVVFNWL